MRAHARAHAHSHTSQTHAHSVGMCLGFYRPQKDLSWAENQKFKVAEIFGTFPSLFHGVQYCTIGLESLIIIKKFSGPVDGGWSEWSWPPGKCFSRSSSRNVRVDQTGRRSCNNPKPQHGGQNCAGEGTITRDCYKNDPGEFTEDERNQFVK